MRPPRKSKIEKDEFYSQNSSSDEKSSTMKVNTASKQRFEIKDSILDIDVEPKSISSIP